MRVAAVNSLLQQYMVVTILLGGFVADQMRYNLESAQYQW